MSPFHKIRMAGGILIILVGCWMLYAQIAPMPPENTPLEMPQAATPIHALNLPGFDREPIHLAQFKGRTVYIKFWATWCSLCLAGLADFSTLAEQFASSPDIAILSIVQPGLNGEVSREDFSEWARAQKLSFPIYFDESGALSKAFGIHGYPSAVYLTKDGSIIKISSGDESNAQILEGLTAQKSDKKVSS